MKNILISEILRYFSEILQCKQCCKLQFTIHAIFSLSLSLFPIELLSQTATGTQHDIVVTGTRSPRTMKETPIRTDIIGHHLLSSSGARDLADALDYLPGARTESNCQNCNTTEIQLLGLPGAYNQILFDGLPLMTGVASVYGVEQVPAALIDRIEVVKGGGSALYGPGAVAGVVNVLPVKPARTGMRATLDYSRIDEHRSVAGSVMASLIVGNDGLLSFYGQTTDQPAVDFNNDGYSELARRRLWTGGVRGEVSIDQATRLTFDYQYTEERRRGGNRLDQAAFLANIAEAIDSKVQRASISVERRLAPATTLTGIYAISRVDRDSFYGGLGAVETDSADPDFDAAAFGDAVAISRRQYGETEDTLHYAELRFATRHGPHDLQIGVQYRVETIEDRNVDVSGLLLGILAAGRFSTLGVFLQDELTVSPALRMVLGARIDKSSELSQAIVSPRVGFWWSPEPAWVFRANWSSGYRSPEIFSEDVHIAVLGAEPVRVRNATGLKAERAHSIALGFDWRPGWSDGAFTLDGQIYSNRIRNTFVLGEIRKDENGGLYQIRENAGGSSVTGAELNFNLRATRQLQLIAGVARISARYDEPQLIFDDGNSRLVTRRYLKSPAWNAVGQIYWTIAPRLDAFLGLRYSGPMDVLNNRTGRINRSPHYLVSDLSVTRHVMLGSENREIDITLGIRNLTDTRQRDLETGAGRDSDYVYGPRTPRSVFVQARALF